MKVKGKVWVFGDDINTDVIFPGKYTYTISDPAEMALHAMEDADERFAQEVESGDIVVAGKNFGCGSSREQAVKCLKAAGVAAILADSFARIYYRNAVNDGLPVAAVKGLAATVKTGDRIEVDFETGQVTAGSAAFSFVPVTGPARDILSAGGLISYVKEKIQKQGT